MAHRTQGGDVVERRNRGRTSRHGQATGHGDGARASSTSFAVGAGNRAISALLSAGNGPITNEMIRSVALTAGNRAATAVVQRRRRVPVSTRSRAAAAGATDAATWVKASMPAVLPLLSATQIGQIQRAIDAATVNPGILAEAGELERRSMKRYGQLVVRDRKLEAAAWRKRRQAVSVSESDRRIRIDAERLLKPDVFAPRRGNAGELAFLQALRARLRSRGVWLRVGDGPFPQLWLSYGRNGPVIPSFLGVVTREHLLECTPIGAMYYRMVYQDSGRVQLERELKRLGDFLQDGMAEHNRQAGVRATAAPGVVPVSDFLGGADFPDASIWDDAWKLYLQALWLIADDHVDPAREVGAVSGVLGELASRKLAAYIERTTSGAASAVKWLNRAKMASAVVTSILLVASGVGIVAGGARAATVAGSVGSGEAAAARQLLQRYLARNPGLAEELASVRLMKGPAGTVARGMTRGRGNSGLGMGQFF